MNLLASLLGWLWWVVLPVRRREAVEAFSAAFPDQDPAGLRRNVGRVAASYVGLLFGRRAVVEGMGLARGGAVCLGGHFAAWDVALVSVARHVPTTITVKEPSNRLAAALIRRLRGQEDLELLPPRGSMADAYAALDAGRLVILVQDQRFNDGIAVPFFGRPARTSAAFAAMAFKTRRPLLGVFQQWQSDGSLVVRFERLPLTIPDDREQAVATLTAASQAFYEQHIREQPWAWWWLHRRWMQ